MLYYFCCCHRCNSGDYPLCYSYRIIIIMWKETGGFLTCFDPFYFGILIFPILVVGSCILSDLHHIIISYITIIINLTFFFGFCIPNENLFISVINIFYSRITEIVELLIICYIFVVLNRLGSYFMISFSYNLFLFIFSTGGGV